MNRGSKSSLYVLLVISSSLTRSIQVHGLLRSSIVRLVPQRALSRIAIAAETPTLTESSPPLPELRPHEVCCGDQQWTDDLFYLRDPEDPATELHLSACARHAAALRSRLSPLSTAIQAELLSYDSSPAASVTVNTNQLDGDVSVSKVSAALRWAPMGPFEWARDESRGEYSTYWRRPLPSSSSGDDIKMSAFDSNLVPVPCRPTYSGGQPYLGACRGVSAFEPEPSKGEWVAYTVDRDGDEKYTLVVAALEEPSEGQKEGDEGSVAGLQVLAGALDIDAPVAWGGPATISALTEGSSLDKAPQKATKGLAGKGMGMAAKKGTNKSTKQKESSASASKASAAGGETKSANVLHGQYIYYARMDETGRPWQLYQRFVPAPGTEAAATAGAEAQTKAPMSSSAAVPFSSESSGPTVSTAAAAAVGTASSDGSGAADGVLGSLDALSGGLERLVYQEPDRAYRLSFRRNRAGTALLVRLASRDGDEWCRLPLNAPPQRPQQHDSIKPTTKDANVEGTCTLTDVVVRRTLHTRCELDEPSDGTLHLLTSRLPNDTSENEKHSGMNRLNENASPELQHAVSLPDAANTGRHWRWVDERSHGHEESILEEVEEGSSDRGSSGSSSTSNDILNSVHCFSDGLVVLEGFDASTGLRAVWTHDMNQWAAESLKSDGATSNGDGDGDGDGDGIDRSRRRCVDSCSSSSSSIRGAKSVWLDDGTFAWASNRNYELSARGLTLVASNLATPPKPLFIHPGGSPHAHVIHDSSSSNKKDLSSPKSTVSAGSNENFAASVDPLTEGSSQDAAPSPAWLQDLEMETLLVPTSDGQTVPVSLVQVRNPSSTDVQEDESAARDETDQDPMNSMDLRGSVVLYGYGAYGSACDATFDPDRLPLLRRGAAFVIAHVRGGGEKGAAWQAEGARHNKGRGVQDFLEVARFLVGKSAAIGPDTGGAPSATIPPPSPRFRVVAAEGRSAGGYLVGTALNVDPSLFAAALLEVPFVHPLGTLADASLPLTVNEWAEFGNPATPAGFAHLSSHSPASNVIIPNNGLSYPPMLLRPAAKDARTGWWEAFKFAARVNAANHEGTPAANTPSTNAASPGTTAPTSSPPVTESHLDEAPEQEATSATPPPLMGGFGAVVDMTEGGHFRPAGRNARAVERSQELAFLMAALNDSLVALQAPLDGI